MYKIQELYTYEF